jgi:acetyl-CoA carboxylase carboxyl transferase subunit alpha
MMFKYSIYSVISPEGCASILYQDAAKANIAAESLKLTSTHLLSKGLVDVIIDEPLGGIHRNPDQAKVLLKNALKQQLQEVTATNINQLVQQRADKLLSFGQFQE